MTWRSGFRCLAITVTVLVVTAALLPVSAPFLEGLRSGWPAAVADQSVPNGQVGPAAVPGADGGSSDDALDALAPEMRAQLADVARAYAHNARFPDYSTPLRDDDWAQRHPRASVARAASLGNVPGMAATLLLDRYIIDRAIDLPVQVRVAAEGGAAMNVTLSSVRVSLKRNGQGSDAIALVQVDAADMNDAVGQTFAGVVPAALLRALPAGDAAVVAELFFSGGQQSVVTAPVQLYDAVARLVALGGARVEGANLVIPARFQAGRAGYFRVEANLFAVRGNVPVSHLVAEFPLAAGNSEGLLKVHAVTLRESGEAGPYVLRDVDIRRVPDQPGDPTTFGTAIAEVYEVNGFPLDAYSAEPWVDPEAQERLEFLRKLGGAPKGLR